MEKKPKKIKMIKKSKKSQDKSLQQVVIEDKLTKEIEKSISSQSLIASSKTASVYTFKSLSLDLVELSDSTTDTISIFTEKLNMSSHQIDEIYVNLKELFDYLKPLMEKSLSEESLLRILVSIEPFLLHEQGKFLVKKNIKY